jgi:hypothetical protein
MLRIAIVLACLVVAGCGGGEDDDGRRSGPSTPATELTVEVWPEGRGGPARERRVECPGAPVCGDLSVQRLAPVPRDMACTAVYGGPGMARVTGTLHGERVDERFRLEDGCQIARWERNRALLGPLRGWRESGEAREPAVHQKGNAGHVTSLLRAQERGSGGDLIDRA